MMARARDVASAGGHEPRIDPAESVFMSILLGHEKELAELRGRSGGRASPGVRESGEREGGGAGGGASSSEGRQEEVAGGR
jgi:hypothetical protein